MHLATIAAILFSALTVSAQAGGSGTTNATELFEEFAKLPTCVVCTAAASFRASKNFLADLNSDDLRRASTASLNMHRPYGLCMPVH